MKTMNLATLSLSISSILLGLTTPVLAQDQVESSASSVLLEEVIVTARKREESAQNVPVAISAFGSQQLEALKIRDLGNLSVGMPNVAMDDIATTPGTANFSIRGLGINSSIPSIDPTVGVFIDGVYIGQNAGVVVDMFDIASIEVLRGPQGTLFGRNVTGGAVLINTKRPGDELEFSARLATEGNPNGDGGMSTYVMASVGGPLGDSFAARVSVYQNTDDGWFVNQFDGKNFGESDTTIFRPVLTWQNNDNRQPRKQHDLATTLHHLHSRLCVDIGNSDGTVFGRAGFRANEFPAGFRMAANRYIALAAQRRSHGVDPCA